MPWAKVTWNYSLAEIPYKVKQEASNFWGQAGGIGGWGREFPGHTGKEKSQKLWEQCVMYLKGLVIVRGYADRLKKVTDLFTDKKTIQANL